MRRKLKLLAVVTGLAVFSLVGVAAASAHGFGGSSERLDRVAEILGVSPEELSAAVTEARSEARTARLEERLTAAVEEEVLTQDEADAIRDWIGGKPESLSNLSHSERHGLRSAVQDETLSEFLAGLVGEEIITQSESDEIASWIGARPTETLEKFRSEFGHGRGHRGGHGFRGHRGGFGRDFGGFPRFGEPAPSTESGAETSTAIVYY